MVIPLAKQGRHVGKFSVVDHGPVRRRQDSVGHLSDLWRTDTSVVDRHFIVAAGGFYRHAMPLHGLTSYQRENEVVEATGSIPAVGRRDAVVVLSGDPPLEGGVGGPQARVLPVDSTLKPF